MNEYITMADGSAVNNSYVVTIDASRINICVKGAHTYSEISNIFGKKTKTQHMVSSQYGDVHEWDGFTDVVLMQIGESESIIGLMKA